MRKHNRTWTEQISQWKERHCYIPEVQDTKITMNVGRKNKRPLAFFRVGQRPKRIRAEGIQCLNLCGTGEESDIIMFLFYTVLTTMQKRCIGANIKRVSHKSSHFFSQKKWRL